MSAAAAPLRLLAILAVLGQVLVGALLIPDDAHAADIAAITGASTLCGAPLAPGDGGPGPGDRHSPLHREPICALSLSLHAHAGPLATQAPAPLSARTDGVVTLTRPRREAPPPLPLRAATLARGPPAGF